MFNFADAANDYQAFLEDERDRKLEAERLKKTSSTPQGDPNVPESLKAILRRRQEADQAKWNVEMPEPKSSSLDAGDCGQFQNINLEES